MGQVPLVDLGESRLDGRLAGVVLLQLALRPFVRRAGRHRLWPSMSKVTRYHQCVMLHSRETRDPQLSRQIHPFLNALFVDLAKSHTIAGNLAMSVHAWVCRSKLRMRSFDRLPYIRSSKFSSVFEVRYINYNSYVD